MKNSEKVAYNFEELQFLGRRWDDHFASKITSLEHWKKINETSPDEIGPLIRSVENPG